MEPGDYVTIYAKPLLEKQPEANAYLVRRIDGNCGIYFDRTLEKWTVQFESGEYAERYILAPEPYPSDIDPEHEAYLVSR